MSDNPTKPTANLTPHEELLFYLESIAALLGEEPSWADNFMQRINTYTQARIDESETELYMKGYNDAHSEAKHALSSAASLIDEKYEVQVKEYENQKTRKEQPTSDTTLAIDTVDMTYEEKKLINDNLFELL